MIKSKYAFLKKLTDQINMKSVSVDKEIDGSSPPSIFIGSWNYPKVYAGPLIAPTHENTHIMDQPEQWITTNKTQEDIIGYRLNLVRGKQEISITDTESLFIEKLQDITMGKKSVTSQAMFNKKPRGLSFNNEESPHGPSAILKEFSIDNVKWDKQLSKTFYDTDLKAADAIEILHQKNIPFSQIQKAFSVGGMGIKNNRKLVPTRWSITACDTIMADKLLKEVKYYPLIDTYKVYEYSSLNNYYAILTMPTEWEYEWMEAFLKPNNRNMIFTDHEYHSPKKGYSRVGGCYYTCKMAILEQLEKEKKQAGCIVFREAYENYMPLGVFNVRENVRNAMQEKPTEYETIHQALKYINSKLRLTTDDFKKESTLLKESLQSRQTTLDQFF
ncbi:MAG: Nre family DNA repair protein [Methanobacteriaceae archaeon]|nr:Nre family DNA repair protein [Methanobacteriaceae archaeon]